jgi:uncharacterized membrane protein
MDILSILIILGLALVLSVAAGAVSGIKVGGEFLGKELAAMMGAFFGPTSVLPAALVGILFFALLK